MAQRILDGSFHIFHVCGDRWYDEEFIGPLDATTYLDPYTGDLYLEVREGVFDLKYEGESWTTTIMGKVCRLDSVISGDCQDSGPPSWSAYERQLPESVLPLKTRANKRGKINPIDAPWQAAW